MKLASVLIVSTLVFTACGGAQPSSQTPSASATCPGPGQPGPAMKGGMMGGQGKDGMMGGGMMAGQGKDGMMGGGMMKGGGMMGGGMMGKGMGDSCPMAVAGTSVRAEEVAGGTAMVFTTTGDVAELRRRVAAMADMHNKNGAEGCPMMKMHDGTSESSPTAPPPSATPPQPTTPAEPPTPPKPANLPPPRPKTKG